MFHSSAASSSGQAPNSAPLGCPARGVHSTICLSVEETSITAAKMAARSDCVVMRNRRRPQEAADQLSCEAGVRRRRLSLALLPSEMPRIA